MGHRLWLLAIAIYRLGVVEIAPYPHCFRTTHTCEQSVKSSPTEPVLSRSSRQILGHLQSPILTEAGTSGRLSFQSRSLLLLADELNGVIDCAHAALQRLQSASSWLVMEQLVSGVCRLSCSSHVAGISPPDVMRGDTGQ